MIPSTSPRARTSRQSAVGDIFKWWVEGVCQGDDATGDSDKDGVCDDLDICTGNDATGDSDKDGDDDLAVRTA